MALTVTESQKIKKAKLDAYLTLHETVWVAALKRAHSFLTDTFAVGTVIRPDDVYKALFPVVESNAQLQTYLAANKLTQQYWFKYFCNYVIAILWDKK